MDPYQKERHRLLDGFMDGGSEPAEPDNGEDPTPPMATILDVARSLMCYRYTGVCPPRGRE